MCRPNSKVCIHVIGLVASTDFFFVELNIDLFEKTLKPVEQVLNDAKLKKTDIDDIVLVGGSTRIPKLVAPGSKPYSLYSSQQS